jgi:indole-3-glycerol phosphate synthase
VILDRILERKREEVAEACSRVPLIEQKKRVADQEPVRSFATALADRAREQTAIIAEVKKGSPSKGVIRVDFDPLAIARVYYRAGAACLSVLTDRDFFMGDLSYLSLIRTAVPLPLLRKDFIIDAYQLYEARNAGADAVLLIAAALVDSRLNEFSELAVELGLDVLLEVHDESELERALATSAPLIGINNRNLSTFVTDLAVTERLLPQVPPGRLIVSESGINSRADIERLQRAGADAFLVGESLMRCNDIATKLQSLLGAVKEKV